MICSDCNRDRKKYSSGLCSTCYRAKYNTHDVCVDCNKTTYKLGIKRCAPCRNRHDKPRLGTPTSPEARKKMSVSHIGLQVGAKHPMWKGGITPINVKIRNSPEIKQWRKAVMARDNYTCQSCGKRGGNMEADHVMPFSLFPELRTDILNGRTLCPPCHRKYRRDEVTERQLIGLTGMRFLEFDLA